MAAEYDVVDQRERRLPIRIFFWLMVLSASQSGARGSLFPLAAFFVAAMTKLFPCQHAIPLSRIALSKKLKATTWRYFHAVYQQLLARYEKLLPASTRRLLDSFKEAYAVDGSIARVYSTIVAAAQSEWAPLIGKRLSEVIPLLVGQTELDVTIQTSQVFGNL